MDCKTNTSRRAALGWGSVVALALIGGEAAAGPAERVTAPRQGLGDEEFRRVTALYAGELGGCRGAR